MTTTITDPSQLWNSALSQLQSQLPQAAFDSFLSDTFVVEPDDHLNDHLTIGTRNPYGREWLEKRLGLTVNRTVSGILGRPIELHFVVAGQSQPEPETPAPAGDDRPMVVRSRRKQRRYFIDNEFIDFGYAAHLGLAAVGVYNVLCRRADFDSQQCWPGKGSMGKDLGIDRRTVRVAIEQLFAFNLVLVEHNYDPDTKRWASDTYTLTDVSEWKPIKVEQ